MLEPLAREWRYYLGDMIGFAEKVISYPECFDQQVFVVSRYRNGLVDEFCLSFIKQSLLNMGIRKTVWNF